MTDRSWIVLRDLPVPLDEALEPEAALRDQVAERLKLPADALGPVVVTRRALDTRRRNPRYIFAVRVEVEAGAGTDAIELGRAVRWKIHGGQPVKLPKAPDGPPPVVIGAGPAGLFAALTLAEAGWPPIVIERGKPVEPRAKDVASLYARGQLNAESNVCFGEGGAGTFSDGKLYTRVGDARVDRFMDTLVALGADPDILVNTRPHLGTDRLVTLLQAIRARLESLGVTFRFETRVEEIFVEQGRLAGWKLADGERIDSRHAVLATGHSARDVYRMLMDAGLPLEARPFAMGFRIEHPQGWVDEARYGRFAGHRALPAADYRLTFNDGETGRGVYSFCMCPGGVVVTTPTRPEELCINGMSHAARSGRFANSAVVVTVDPDDVRSFGGGTFGEDPLIGVRFQQDVERRAYEAGGGDFTAPAARVSDFLAGEVATPLGPTSYRRGIVAGDLAALYPTEMIEALRRALTRFEQQMRGFAGGEGQLIGVETRTAAPVRLPRDDDFQAVGAQGLYPAGEGLGYGGGIASAAIDGIRVAESMIASVAP